MIKLKIKKIIAKIILVSLLFSNFQQILLEIPVINAQYISWSNYTLHSSWSGFTLSGSFNTNSGNYLNSTWNLDFDVIYNSGSFYSSEYNVFYTNPYQYSSWSSSLNLPASYIRADFTSDYFSWYVWNNTWTWYFLSWSHLNFSNLKEWHYAVNINAFWSTNNDNMGFDFTVDRTAPYISNIW
jgi:hypothetical protein